jgi:hypothetical protein
VPEKKPHNQPADENATSQLRFVPAKNRRREPHNQPADENATSQLQLRTDEGTTQPASRQKCNLATTVCASKEQTKKPHNPPADKNATSQLQYVQQRIDEGTTQPASRRKCNLATMCQQRTDERNHTTSQQTKIQPRIYVPAKNRRKKPHIQPADENATSQLCASKEQMKEPQNQLAKTGNKQ